jgi:hypothetical protein
MAEQPMFGVLSGATMTTSGSAPPPPMPVAAGERVAVRAVPAVQDGVALGSRHWGIVAVFVAAMFVGAELFLRSDVLWQVPIEYVLQNENDRYMKATWLVHQPPASSGNQIMVLGSSVAGALTELPNNESQEILRDVLGQPQLQLISLTVFGGCYAEHLTLLEGALAHGHQPSAIVLFSWPNCLGGNDDTDALLARRMPLVSSSLVDLEGTNRSFDVRIQAALVRISAVQRYRYTVNAWLRNTWRNVLRGRAPWRPIAFEGHRRVTAWQGDWELDRDRYQRLADLPRRMTPGGPGSRQLAALLEIARMRGIPVLIVESPWSPPFFDILDEQTDTYLAAMQAIAAQYGATYIDPNRSRRLSRELFNDLYHVNQAGARAYLPAVGSELRRLGKAW